MDVEIIFLVHWHWLFKVFIISSRIVFIQGFIRKAELSIFSFLDAEKLPFMFLLFIKYFIIQLLDIFQSLCHILVSIWCVDLLSLKHGRKGGVVAVRSLGSSPTCIMARSVVVDPPTRWAPIWKVWTASLSLLLECAHFQVGPLASIQAAWSIMLQFRLHSIDKLGQIGHSLHGGLGLLKQLLIRWDGKENRRELQINYEDVLLVL